MNETFRTSISYDLEKGLQMQYENYPLVKKGNFSCKKIFFMGDKHRTQKCDPFF